LSRCSATTRAGEPCRGVAIGSSAWCPAHHPEYADARRRRASKGGKRGGRGRPQAELANIKDRLQELAEDVLEKKVDKGVAAVASQVLNVYLRAVSVALKARERLELVERLEVLEETLARNKEKRWYGA
jgi:hypothetical protein